MTLFSTCDLLQWPWLALWWLLPFLLGLLLGWLIWGSYKKKLEDAVRLNTDLNTRIGNLEVELAACRADGQVLSNDILSLQGEIKELKMARDTDKIKAQSVVAPIISSFPVRQSIYAALKEDQLQVVEGIGPKMESVLNDKGVRTWEALASLTVSELRGILDSYGSKYKIIDPVSWTEQAAFARDGKWQELINRQKQLSGGTMEVSNETDSKVEKMLIKMGVLKKYKKDDLKAIEGIGPKIEQLFKNAGITTWKMLSNSKVSRLNEILSGAGDRYKLADPSTWPKQAQYAANGQWKELDEYQDFLQGGRER